MHVSSCVYPDVGRGEVVGGVRILKLNYLRNENVKMQLQLERILRKSNLVIS